MGYKVPDWKKSIGQHIFELETDDGTFNLPKFEYLTGEQAARFADAKNIEGGIYTVLNEICPGAGDALRPLPQVYLREMVKAWQKDSGIDAGESSAS